jgi:hypothetical protein
MQVVALQNRLIKLTPAFIYRNSSALSQARYTTTDGVWQYDGGGYAHDFDVKNGDTFDNITALLKEMAWIDGATRMVVVELSVYSAPSRLLATVFMMVRFSAHDAPCSLSKQPIHQREFDIEDCESFGQILALLKEVAWIDGARMVVVELSLYAVPPRLLATFLLIMCHLLLYCHLIISNRVLIYRIVSKY